MTRNSITLDVSEIISLKKAIRDLGEKAVLKAARKGAQKGSNIIGKEVRSAAPKDTGALKKGFKKTREHSKLKGKFGYQYAMDSAKNDIFQKPVKAVGKYGGKKSTAYYPASVEYGFMTSAGSAGGYSYTPGENGKKPTVTGTKHIEGTHFAKKAGDAAEPKAIAEMKKVLFEEIDKEWAKK